MYGSNMPTSNSHYIVLACDMNTVEHEVTLKFTIPGDEIPSNYTLQNLRAAANYWISGPKFHASVVTRTVESPEGVAVDTMSREAARGSDDFEVTKFVEQP